MENEFKVVQRVWDDMEFQQSWNMHALTHGIYSIRRDFGEDQYFKLKAEFTADYLKEKLA